jgi:hypothetical protein
MLQQNQCRLKVLNHHYVIHLKICFRMNPPGQLLPQSRNKITLFTHIDI